MPFSGNGTWTNVYDWNQDAAAGIKILASRQQTQWNDTASNGLSNVICKDGQTTTTAIIPFASGITLSGGSTLSVYVEGNWTPTIFGTGTAGTPTYTTQVGRYEKIGRQVTARFRVSITSKGGALGNLSVGGLPFTAANVTTLYGTGSTIAYTGLTFSAGFTQLGIGALGNSTTIDFFQNGSAQNTNQIDLATLVSDTTTIYGQVIYNT